MSARHTKLLRRTVNKAIAKRGLTVDAILAEKLRPRPRWCPPFIWRWALRLVLKEPPPQPDFRLINSVIHALRRARATLARRGSSLTGGPRRP